MERVIALLREKNHHLERFYWLNEQELISFGVGNFESVEPFYQAREILLDKISSIEKLIERENNAGVPFFDEQRRAALKNSMREEVELLLRSKDELVKSILAQDLQILAYVDREKSNIIRELRTTANAKRAVGAYANSERIKQLDQD